MSLNFLLDRLFLIDFCKHHKITVYNVAQYIRGYLAYIRYHDSCVCVCVWMGGGGGGKRNPEKVGSVQYIGGIS